MFITSSDQVTRPFTLCCVDCDAGMDLLTPEAAIEAGWVEIEEAFDCPTANYLGICAECQERPTEPDSPK
jgi:hypothetical protein